MLYLRDRTIMKLAEDRDLVKIKLTKAMNMNIELSRQLMKYQKMQPIATTMNPPSPIRAKSPVNNQIREEVADLRRKCTELDDIYHHLKHHLFALRNVFADLGGNTATMTNDSGSGYHMDEDDCSSINSSISKGSLPNNAANRRYKQKAYIVEDNDEDDGNESGDTDFRPLPPTRPSLLKNSKLTSKTNVDDNNNNGTSSTTNQLAKIPKAVEPNKDQTSISDTIAVQEPQLSNFDIWYNS